MIASIRPSTQIGAMPGILEKHRLTAIVAGAISTFLVALLPLSPPAAAGEETTEATDKDPEEGDA